LTKAVTVIVFPSGGKEKECEAVDALIQISGMLIDATQIFLNVGYGDKLHVYVRFINYGAYWHLPTLIVVLGLRMTARDVNNITK